MSVPLVDYHCHLDLYPDYERVFAASRTSGVQLLAVTTTPLAWPRNRELAADIPNIRVGLGLHPQLVGRPEADLSTFTKLLPMARFVGEVGLDAGPRHYKSLDLQREVLAEVLRLSASHPARVLSIHCVRAFKPMFELIDAHWNSTDGTLIFHWFSGSVADARRAIERGCYFSINPQMATNEIALRVLREVPLHRILTETDGPFANALSGSPRTPGDVIPAIEMITSVKGVSSQTARQAVWDNVRAIDSRLRT